MAERLCGCGCGEPIEGPPGKRFLNERHRKHYHSMQGKVDTSRIVVCALDGCDEEFETSAQTRKLYHSARCRNAAVRQRNRPPAPEGEEESPYTRLPGRMPDDVLTHEALFTREEERHAILRIEDVLEGERAVYLSDLQIPFEDADLVEAVDRFISDFEPDRIFYVGDTGDLYCVAPDTPVLRADFCWTRAAELCVGDTIWAFDENKHVAGRRLRLATVTAAGVRDLPTYRVFLETGEVLECTDDHAWLTRHGAQGADWVATKKLRDRRSKLRRYFHPAQRLTDFESGWMAGFLDGEGSIDRYGRVSFGQVEGSVLDRAMRWLRLHGYDFHLKHRATRSPRHKSQGFVYLRGGLREGFRLLAEIGPERLANDAARLCPGRRLEHHDAPLVVYKQFLGSRPQVTLATSTTTFFASGFGAHNTISVFDKNPTRRFHLEDEVRAVRARLDRHAEIAPQAKRYFLDGNHEFRLIRELMKSGGEFYGLMDEDTGDPVISIPKIYGLRKRGIVHVPWPGRIDYAGFIVTHGPASRRAVGNVKHAAKWMLEYVKSSGLCGDFHRNQSYCSVGDEGQSQGWIVQGCLCRLDPDYAPFPDWQQGFTHSTVVKGQVHPTEVKVFDRAFVAHDEVYSY